MSLLLPAFIFFCGIGSVVFASTVIDKRRTGVVLSAFVLALVLFGWHGSADPAWIGILAAGAAILHICFYGRRGVAFINAVAGGILAASLAWMLKVEGLPIAISISLAAIFPAASIHFARRPDFSRQALTDESMLLVSAMGLAIAALPEILAGWNSALILNRDGFGSSGHAISIWTMVLGAGAAMLGGCYSSWRHR